MADGVFTALPSELKVDYVLALIQSLHSLPVVSALPPMLCLKARNEC